MMTVGQALDAIERDCREPDKVLLGVASLRRILFDLGALVQDPGDPAEAYAELGECDFCPRAAVVLCNDTAMCQRCADQEKDIREPEQADKAKHQKYA